MQRNLHCFFRSEGRLIAGTIRFFDLFSGIGGFREGLHRAGGFTCVGHCEADAYADHNYRVLFDTEGEWFCNDARNIETERMPDFDLLCAGFPCQAFSIAGRREGFADARGTLFFEVARLVADKRPAYFLLENVPGLLSHDKGRTFHTILSTLSELGYHVEWKVLNSKDFGVPSQGSGCILSDILMEDVPEKYYLSQKQMEQLLYKSMLANREKESTQKKD
ncbi:MAG: DNA cytosine methyltransferase [Clostridium sp.]